MYLVGRMGIINFQSITVILIGQWVTCLSYLSTSDSLQGWVDWGGGAGGMNGLLKLLRNFMQAGNAAIICILRLAQKKAEAMLYQCAYSSWPSIESITLLIWDCHLAPLSSRNEIEQ